MTISNRLKMFVSQPIRIVMGLLAGLAMLASFGGQTVQASSGVQVSVFATGLNNPRGMRFGPDGSLYVAEGGTGGTNSTVGQCAQVPAPIGPDTGGKTARISKINAWGVRSTVVDHLPSTYINPNTGPDTMGVAGVAFLGGQLYAVLAGGGCSHGNPDVPNGVIRVTSKGQWRMIANLSAFYQAHPVAQPNAGDFEPDGTPFSMIAVHDSLYIVEANHGEIDRISPNGKIHQVIDLSASQGHIVPTSVAYRDGYLYVSDLTTYPLPQGAAKIYKIGLNGELTTYATGLTNVISLAFGPDGKLYALESNVGVPFPTPGSGELVRIDAKGAQQVVLTGLYFPTAMTFGLDGRLYVTNWGYGYHDTAQGEILRLTFGK